jgi:mannose-6-phosphate isomerase
LSDLYPLELSASLRPKIWGRRDLAPFFGEQPEPIGEAWFSFEENTVANGPLAGQTIQQLTARYGSRLLGDSWRPSSQWRRSAGEAPVESARGAHLYFPILSKLLFTSAKLSVQVHPDDEFALADEGGPGKTEAWYVVDAEPGSSIALGLTESLEGEALKRSAASGEIERLLNWIEVHPGDTYFVPPGTIHSIGPGLTLCEVQQNSDLTYRLYDFKRLGADGKPRELHLDKANAVARSRQVPAPQPAVSLSDGPPRRDLLAACPYFAIELLRWEQEVEYAPDPSRFELLLFLGGEGRISGYNYKAGSTFLIPSSAERFTLEPRSPSSAIRAYVPDLPALRRSLERARTPPEEIDRLLIK